MGPSHGKPARSATRIVVKPPWKGATDAKVAPGKKETLKKNTNWIKGTTVNLGLEGPPGSQGTAKVKCGGWQQEYPILAGEKKHDASGNYQLFKSDMELSLRSSEPAATQAAQKLWVQVLLT